MYCTPINNDNNSVPSVLIRQIIHNRPLFFSLHSNIFYNMKMKYVNSNETNHKTQEWRWVYTLITHAGLIYTLYAHNINKSYCHITIW